MHLDDYVKSGESILCQSQATKKNTSDTGHLAVTDSRIVFIRDIVFSDTRVLDIDLHHVTSVEYRTRPIHYEALLGGFLLLSAAIFGFFVDVSFLDFSSDEISAVSVILGGLGIIFCAIALDTSETLIIRTPNQSYSFKKGDFSSFPHAIRGGTNH